MFKVDPFLAAATDKQTEDSVEFPSVGLENLIRLGEDLLRVASVPDAILRYPIMDEDCQDILSISDLISRNGTSTTGLSSEEAAVLEGTFRKVDFPRWIFPQSLTLRVVRSYRAYLSSHSSIPRCTYGSDFIRMLSSADRESSPA